MAARVSGLGPHLLPLARIHIPWRALGHQHGLLNARLLTAPCTCTTYSLSDCLPTRPTPVPGPDRACDVGSPRAPPSLPSTPPADAASVMELEVVSDFMPCGECAVLWVAGARAFLPGAGSAGVVSV